MVSRFITGLGVTPCNGACVAEQIVSILFGSKKTRLGAAPTEEQHKHMLDLVNYYVHRNLPIQSVTMWGALKGYGLWEDRLDADFCDAMALRRFMCLHSQITAIYEPGIRFNILFEDLAPEVTEIESRIASYYNSLQAMIAVLGMMGFVNIVRESHLLTTRGVSFESFVQKAHQNADVIYRYWLAMCDRCYQFDATMPEYQDLLAIGWQGIIPQEQWEFYRFREQKAPIAVLSDGVLAALVVGDECDPCL